MGGGKIEVNLQSRLNSLIVVKLASVVRSDRSDPVRFSGKQGEGSACGELLCRAPQGADSHQARAALHHGEHARGAAAVHRVNVPVADALARLHGRRAGTDHLLAREPAPAVMAGIAFAALLARSPQIEPESATRSFVLPDPAIDGFMTHDLFAFHAHPADDLLGAQIEADQTLNGEEMVRSKAGFAPGSALSAAGFLRRMRGTVVSVVRRGVALDLPIKRAGMPSQPPGNFRHADVEAPHRRDLMSFFRAQLLINHAVTMSHFRIESKADGNPH